MQKKCLHQQIKKRRLKPAFLVTAIFSILNLHAQVTLIIDDLPNTTPEKDTIFICGTFNNWNVKDQNFMLHKQLDGRFAITLPDSINNFEYKFTRGSWLKVETNAINEHLPNRLYNNYPTKKVIVKIANWQDLGGVKKFKYISFIFFALAFNGLALLFLIYRIEKRNQQLARAYITVSTIVIATLLGGVFFDQSNLVWQSHIRLVCQVLLFIWGPVLFLFSAANAQIQLQQK